MCAGGEVVRRLPLDMTICIIGLSTVTSSVWDDQWIRWISDAVIAILLILSLYFILAAFDVLEIVSSQWFLRSMMIGSVVLVLLHCFALCWRIRDVRAVMRAGTVWQCLSLSVDSLYVMMVTMNIVLYVLLDTMLHDVEWHTLAISAILAAVTFAFAHRVINDSLFILFARHERRIVESMKVSRVEYLAESTGTDQMYNHIYERVLRYFEKNKPYLNNDLTINDIVEVIYTNKLYISKAISHCTGRNFCQFVNYHRIIHAVECFRENPQLKVVDLAGLSGFNSTTSFSAAFRLYMGEKPGDWCRKERVTLSKK
jgi:AraC-like DNA-binding protein